MRRNLSQIFLLVLLVSLCVSAVLVVRHILDLPFRSTNDALHDKDFFLKLDFMIPAGVHIDEKMKVGDVLKMRFRQKGSFYEKGLETMSGVIPPRYRYLSDLIVFMFWVFCFMTVMRVFTFVGYGRALRASLLLGGLTYYFMPDFSPGKWDDWVAVLFPLGIISFRFFLRRRKRKRMQEGWSSLKGRLPPENRSRGCESGVSNRAEKVGNGV
jgi:hypothetical protein